MVVRDMMIRDMVCRDMVKRVRPCFSNTPYHVTLHHVT